MTSLRHEDTLSHPVEPRSNQVGIVTALAAAYGLAYLVFERAGIGSQGLRDLLGNVAFMPLNIAVAALNWFASRQTVLDVGVRRALRIMAFGALSVFIGNCISVWYLLVLQSKPTASPADIFYLADSSSCWSALLHVPAQPPHPGGALEAGPRRRHGPRRRRRARLVLRDPARRPTPRVTARR